MIPPQHVPRQADAAAHLVLHDLVHPATVARDCPSQSLCSWTGGRRRPARWGLDPRRQAVSGPQVGEDTLAGRRKTLAG